MGAGIPAYGHSGLADEVDDFRAHGKDERVPVKSFLQGHEYLYRLVKVLSGGGSIPTNVGSGSVASCGNRLTEVVIGKETQS
jgi:hypothetical protein